MPQHFQKSAGARDLTLMDIAKMSEEECHHFFCKVRWKSDEQQTCPHCGSVNQHYYRRKRWQWRCKDCHGYFSVTSGTPLHGHKMDHKTMLMGLMLFTHAASGIAADRLSHEMDVQVKTAHVFLGKIRESLMASQDASLLSGVVQIDGAHFCGMPRFGRRRKRSDRLISIAGHVKEKFATGPAHRLNRAPRSRTNRTNWEKKKNRRIVMALRQVSSIEGKGAERTITVICKSENSRDAISLANRFIATGSIIMTDENPAYARLSEQIDLTTMSRKWTHKTVNHAVEFSADDGTNDNQCESYFSRMRRWVKGVSHQATPRYLADRSVEFSWREDHRRLPLGMKLELLLTALFFKGPSLWWRGYWQGHHRKEEILYEA